MLPVIAEIVLASWQVIFLSVLCFASLVVGLYCLLFMVPLKSFMEQVNSLGGGMRGVRAHVDGVRQEVESRIDSLEESLREELRRQRQDLRSSISSTADTARAAREKLRAIDGSLHDMQAKLRENGSDVSSLAREMEVLRNRHAGLSSDFEVLESELEGAVQRSVNNSYQRLESTVLGALEALQDEMLRAPYEGRPVKDRAGNGRSGAGRPYRRPSSKKSGGNGATKIIAAEPLFADTEHESDSPGAPEEVEVTPGSEQS